MMHIPDERFLRSIADTVTIMRPMPSVYPRGAHSGKAVDPQISFRVSDDTAEDIERAAHLLGMTRSAFIRWCAVNVATDILKQHTKFLSTVK